MTNSIKDLNELSDLYLSQVAEQEESDNTPENVKVRVMQIVKAIRYKAKKEGGNIVKAFNDYMGGQSGIGAAERQMIKQRLGLQEEVGITTSEKIKKALKDQELKRKEEAAVEKAKKIRKEEVVNEKLDYDPMDDPDFDPREAEKKRGVSGKNNPKGGKKLKDLTKEEVVNEIIDPKGARRQDAAKPKKETPLTPEQKAKRDKANRQFDKDYYRPNPKEYPTMWKKREESYSNWRDELREVADDVPVTDKEMEVKIKEKKVKNKIVINPPMQEEIKKMGGEILEMTEVEEQGSLVGLSPQEVTTMKRRALLDVRLSRLRQRSLSKVKPEGEVEPEVKKEDYETKKKGEVLKALDKKKFVKRYGKEKAPDVMYAVAAKTAKQKGDTSKSDDRYAYEEFSDREINMLTSIPRHPKGSKVSYRGGKKVVTSKSGKEMKARPDKDGNINYEEVQVEEKKLLPKIKMYRKAGNLARAGDEKSMKRQTKMVSVLNKETSKGYKDAALAKLRDGGSPKHQTQEDYKKLPVAKMASKISKKQFKAGQSGDVKTISKKSTETGKMIGVLDTHDPQRSKAKSKIKEGKAFDFIKKFMKEDEAYKKTVKDLKDKFGTGVLASKQDFEDHKKREAAKPLNAKQIQKKDERSAAQREVDARYGRTPWNKKGSLGT